MSFETNIIFIISGIIELVSLIICIEILGVHLNNRINRGRIPLSLISFIGISVLVLIFKYSFNNSMAVIAAMLYFFRFILSIYILYGHINRLSFFLTAFWDLSIYLIITSISNILANIIGKSTNDVSYYVMMSIMSAALIIVLNARKKCIPQRNAAALLTIPNHIYIMLILMIVFLSAMPSLINQRTDYTTIKESFLIAIIAILTVILICIIASLILNVLAKQYFTAVSQMMQKQVDLQINHYKALEKMDAEIRRFRHDYTNHLQSILSLLQMNDCSQAEEYILNLRDLINKTKSELHIFYTGNKLADALLSGKSSEFDERCRIEYSGIIPNSINNVDLCVILSNALDNAIEACQMLPSPGVISVYATKQQGYFVLSIKNPTICSENYYTIPATTKTDKEQHGMGLYNIESTVKKHDGQMKIKCENGFFELMITMKI